MYVNSHIFLDVNVYANMTVYIWNQIDVFRGEKTEQTNIKSYNFMFSLWEHEFRHTLMWSSINVCSYRCRHCMHIYKYIYIYMYIYTSWMQSQQISFCATCCLNNIILQITWNKKTAKLRKYICDYTLVETYNMDEDSTMKPR